MDAQRPLIGLTIGRDLPHHPDYLRLRRTYPDAILAAGGAPVLIPPMDDPTALRALFDALDGIIFPGGADVDPARYGETRDATTEVDEVLDHLELRLAEWAVSADLPTLGICRGQQLLNVALGGALIQDLPREPVLHRQPGRRSEQSHTIRVAEGSRLAAVLGDTSIQVNSFHHQAVREVGRGLHAVAWAPDGVIEGTESVDHAFLLTIQFHPEDLVADHEPSRRLFLALVEASRERARRRHPSPARR
ncbi:MAG: gamma-glutamyl-gamma-aminobutyrate hydrolase family protein [Chloroflexi bacterium]|nr:gamma-glutamyl-gamma-aminobutyrate hydrolase family protein [Chloroflexota bacterium]